MTLYQSERGNVDGDSKSLKFNFSIAFSSIMETKLVIAHYYVT